MSRRGFLAKAAASVFWLMLFLGAFGACWQCVSPRPLVRIYPPEGFCNDAFFGTDGAHLWTQQFFRCFGGSSVRCWNLPTGRERILPRNISGPPAHFSVHDVPPTDRFICEDHFNPDRKDWLLLFVQINAGQEWFCIH